MMYRDVEILSTVTVADSGTKTVDLDVTEPITELVVRVKLTNESSHNINKIPTLIVSKLEIVDGGTVYASLDGPQAAAGYFYETGQYPNHSYHERQDWGQDVHIPLRFGRFLGDPTRNLDVSRLRNPQLKITWAKDTLHLTNTVQLGVRARVMGDVAGASAALLTKSVRAFTTVGSGIEETELPTEYPIRRLFIQPYALATPPHYVLSQFKLDCDAGKFIPFDLDIYEWMALTEQERGHCTVRQRPMITNQEYRESYIGRTYWGTAFSPSTQYMTGCSCALQSNPLIYANFHDGTPASDLGLECGFVGTYPHNVMCLTFGLPDDPATWFNAAAFRKVLLKLTQVSAAATCTILVQQDRPL